VAPVYDSVWTSSLVDVGVPVESYTVKREYQGGKPVTRVDMYIYVPAGLLFSFQTYDQVTTGLLGTGQVLAGAYGSSGSATHLEFTLAEP
jgi:hypothetical protein